MAGGKLEIMLITSRDTGRWILPKGWIDKGEQAWGAAEREAREEAGLKGRIAREAIGSYFYEKIRRVGRTVPCEVTVYPLKVQEASTRWKEQAERERRWFPLEVAAKLVSEPGLALLLNAFGQLRKTDAA